MLRDRTESPSLTDCARLILATITGDKRTVESVFAATHPAPRNPADWPDAYRNLVESVGMLTGIASEILRDLAACKGQDPGDYARALVRSVQEKEAAGPVGQGERDPMRKL